MTQRPIVTLIVERVEVPVGFRTKGPNNRLIIVEAIGDMVLRNGKRIVCLKLRRSDEVGLDNISYADDITDKEWDVPAPCRKANAEKPARPAIRTVSAAIMWKDRLMSMPVRPR